MSKTKQYKCIVCPDCSGAGTVMKKFYLIDPSDGSDSEVACETCTPDNTIEDSGECFIFVDLNNKHYLNSRIMKKEDFVPVPDKDRLEYLQKTLYRN